MQHFLSKEKNWDVPMRSWQFNFQSVAHFFFYIDVALQYGKKKYLAAFLSDVYLIFNCRF